MPEGLKNPRNRGLALAAIALLLLLIGGATIAFASSGSPSATVEDEGAADDDASEEAISGSALERASEVALDHTGGGTVTATEIEDEESYYEVEVTLDDGSQVDVQLDEDFNVVGSEGESGNEED